MRSRLLATILAASALAAPFPSGAYAQAFGNSFGGLQVSGDQPISIESDQLDVSDAQGIATFTGDVTVTQGDTLMKTSTLVVHYAKDEKAADAKAGGAKATEAKATPAAAKGKASMPGSTNQITKLEASGKVYIKSQDQVATADKANFDMQTQVAVLTDDVVLTQGDNVATGCRLTIHMDTSKARLESNCGKGSGSNGGRVKMMLTPQNNGQPKQQ